MELYMKGKVFCGNQKCNKECARNISHVPRNVMCMTDFTWKPDKNGECEECEPITQQDGE